MHELKVWMNAFFERIVEKLETLADAYSFKHLSVMQITFNNSSPSELESVILTKSVDKMENRSRMVSGLSTNVLQVYDN